MSLKTRLDGRSETNNSFAIRDRQGHTMAEVKIVGGKGVTLEVRTVEGMYIEKPNGWRSEGEVDVSKPST